jgi:hypothetical protein
MNPFDDQLNRLFRAAAQVPADPVSAPAYGLESRAMAAWREAQSSRPAFWDMTLLLRALVLASLIMAVSAWPALSGTTNPFAEFLQLTDSTVPSDEAP